MSRDKFSVFHHSMLRLCVQLCVSVSLEHFSVFRHSVLRFGV